jgi:alpha-galactosidase
VKVALIGAGSAQFAQTMITDILAIEGLDAGTFALVDPDTERLELTHEVAEQLIKLVGKPWTVQATTERRDVLPGCDYVINTIEVGGLANVEFEMDGEDLYPRLLRAAEDPAIYEQDPVRFEMLRQFGAFTTESSGHVSEYVPYFRKRKDVLERFTRLNPAIKGGARAKRWPRDRADHDERLRIDLARERRGERVFYLERSLEHGAYIIEGHALNRPQAVYGNVYTTGLIENLPQDCCVELACLVDHNGIQPVHFGRLPTQLAALDSAHIMVHDLMVQSLLNDDREAAVHALMLDPLTAAVCSAEEIRQMFDEMAAAQKGYLPHFINPE